ncbi:PP2C family protein-serine/threonine phosphatase [Streptomyces thermolineatus]|uniref:PP2C family protein-serine/threonine phosphatase n=1 Tax=Streptomyces thermolineatus TaxID=44033 RepID=A0ABP5YJA1_9ACTN
MASGDPGERSRAVRLWRHPRSITAMMLAFPLGLLAIEEFTTPDIRLGPLMAAGPALAAVFCSPMGVLVVLVVTLLCVAGAAAANLQLYEANFLVQMVTTVLIGAAAMWAADVRRRREKELAQARWVAEVTQKVLLRPLPRRLGSLEIASLYLAADDEAAIGGDLYAAARVDGTVRLMVGDVQGKGMDAVETVSYLLGAFRQAARSCVALPVLVPYLECSFRADVEEAAEAERRISGAKGPERRMQEGFVTALVVDVPEDGGPIRLVNRGHPPPLLLRHGKVLPLEQEVPGLPLGLGDLDGTLGGAPTDVDTVDFEPGDTLLLYTDGVSEARDEHGVFYPLADRLADWTGYAPGDLLETVRGDLLHHARSRLGDDVALVAVRRTA